MIWKAIVLTMLLWCFLLAQGFSPEVIEHARAGAEAQKQGHFDVAIREFRKVTELQPDSAISHANLGEACFQNGDYVTALPELERALQLDPKMVGTHVTLGVALLLLGDAGEALPHLEKSRMPQLLGLAYLDIGRLGSAISAFHGALEQKPSDPSLLYYFGRATALAAKRTLDQMVALRAPPAHQKQPAGSSGPDPVQEVMRLQTALAQHPDDPDLLSQFHQAAELAAAQSFDKVPAGSARGHQVAAERLAAQNHLSEAEGEYAEALRLNTHTSGVHLALGNVLAAEHKWPGAIAEYRAEVNLRPFSAEACYRLGDALRETGQAHEAELALKRGDQITSHHPEILLVIGESYLASKDSARAEALWTRLIESGDSGFAAQAHLSLAALYRSDGKLPQADKEVAAFQKLEGQTHAH